MNRRLRVLLAGAAALLVVAVVAGGFAVLQGQRAADEARNATEQKLLAQQAADNATQQQQLAQQAARDARSRELIASALAARDQDPSLAKLLAVEAMNVVSTPTYQSTSVLHQVLAADPIIARYSWPTDQPVGRAVGPTSTPTGQLLVASGAILPTATSRSPTRGPGRCCGPGRTGTWALPAGTASSGRPGSRPMARR